jgi:hypothetical protein
MVGWNQAVSIGESKLVRSGQKRRPVSDGGRPAEKIDGESDL